MDLVISDHPLLIIMFGMHGCPACSDYMPKLRKVAARYPHVPTFSVDVNKAEDAADKFGVTVTPTTYLLKNGRVVRKFEGEGTIADIERLFRYAEGTL